MNPLSLLDWMLLSTVLLGAWWLCYRVALRQERSFAYNRWFLVLGPLLAAGLPWLPLGWPSGWQARLGGVPTVLLPTVRIGAEGTAAAPGTDWLFWAGVVYLCGVVFMLVRLGVELSQLWLLARKLTHEKCDGYTLVPTHGQVPTSSFGRTVFWDETLALSEAEAHQVLCHELAHVQQGHTYDRLLLELLRALLWFNPFVHLCSRALALTHEFLADEAALRRAAAQAPACSPSHSYTHLLARQVATRLGFSVPLAHTFSHSQTLRRIAMIHQTSPIRRWKQWLALPLVALSLFTVACERATEAVAPVNSALSSITEDASTPPPPPPPAEIVGTPPPPPPPPKLAPEAPAAPAPKVYIYVEQMPQLVGGGGNKAIVEYIQQHLAYPQVAAANRKMGRVFVSFVVAENGEVKGAQIIKGLAPAYDGAVLDAVAKLPRFVPGRQDGKAVAVSFTVPILFASATLPDGQQVKIISH